MVAGSRRLRVGARVPLLYPCANNSLLEHTVRGVIGSLEYSVICETHNRSPNKIIGAQDAPTTASASTGLHTMLHTLTTSLLAVLRFPMDMVTAAG